jgi:hypothetical protein
MFEEFEEGFKNEEKFELNEFREMTFDECKNYHPEYFL